MLRSAAKNHAGVTDFVVDPADYAVVLDELAANGHYSYETSPTFVAKMLVHSGFTMPSDRRIFHGSSAVETKPRNSLWLMTLSNQCVGENPQQIFGFFLPKALLCFSIASINNLTVRIVSSNIRDADALSVLSVTSKDRPSYCGSQTHEPMQDWWLADIRLAGLRL